jgi:hypothetical protein
LSTLTQPPYLDLTQFLRYSALGLGVWWGYTKLNRLVNEQPLRDQARVNAQKSKHLEEARIAYEAQVQRQEAPLALKDGSINC